MPPGMLFAVYDTKSGNADYIPPEYSDIPELLDELVSYNDSFPLTKRINRVITIYESSH